MGRDKALIVLEGRALAVRVAAAIAAAGATSVVAVGGEVEALRGAGLTAVPDAEPGAGPLTGIVTALGAVPDDIVFVAACDLVAPSAGAVTATVLALAADPLADVAAPVIDGRRQWMHAAWRRRAEMPLAAAFAAGERAVHAAVSAGGLRAVDVAVDPRSVVDADTPSDLPVAEPGATQVPGGGAVRPNR
jgi:molybdopterin-guanine dinucleotide biosynthesis protein A